MLTVNVRDRYARQLFFRYSIEAPQIDSVHLPDGCLGANTERTHAAVLAEEVLVLLGVKQVLRHLCFT